MLAVQLGGTAQAWHTSELQTQLFCASILWDLQMKRMSVRLYTVLWMENTEVLREVVYTPSPDNQGKTGWGSEYSEL